MNRHKIWKFGAMVCLVGLGFSDTADGQITTTPALSSGMSFQVQSGGAVATKVLGITTTNGPTTLVVTVPANQTWLTVAGNPAATTFYPNSPASLNVTVNTNEFVFGQIVSTTIAIAIYGQPTTQINFPVTLTVGAPSLLSANPANLTFTAVQNSTSGSPNSIPVTITSSGAQLNYNVSATTNSGGNWILLTNTSGTTGGTAGFQVQVNPAGLAAGNYSGLVYVQSTSTGDSVSITVSLTVTVGSTLNVTGTLQNYVYQYASGQGSFSAQQQTLMVSTTSGSLNYAVTLTPLSTPNTNWLVLSQTGGLATSTPQPVYLSLSYQYVAALSPGTYTIQVTIAPTGVIEFRQYDQHHGNFDRDSECASSSQHQKPELHRAVRHQHLAVADCPGVEQLRRQHSLLAPDECDLAKPQPHQRLDCVESGLLGVRQRIRSIGE